MRQKVSGLLSQNGDCLTTDFHDHYQAKDATNKNQLCRR